MKVSIILNAAKDLEGMKKHILEAITEAVNLDGMVVLTFDVPSFERVEVEK